MRYSLGRRIAAATMCAMVAVSSVNVEAIAQVTGADAGAALEAVAQGVAGAITSDGVATQSEGEALGTRELNFVGAGVRVFYEGVEATGSLAVDAGSDFELMLVAKAGYELGAHATLVTNVEDPVLTTLAVENAAVVIPAGTLTTDGTLNFETTLTGEPIEDEAAAELASDDAAAASEAATADAANDAEKNGEAADAVETTGDEDLAVSLDELTSVTSAEDVVEQVGDGASDLRYTLEASSYDSVAVANGTALLSTSDDVTLTQMTAEADVSNPAFEGYAYVDGAVIKVTAGEGVLPEGTRVLAKRVSDEKYAAAVNDAMGDVLGASIAYDITLVDEAGNEVQPSEAVNVAIFDALAEEASVDEATAVFHVSDDAREVQVVTARQLDAQVQSFDVEHFSIYLVGVQNASGMITGDGSSFSSPYIIYGYATSGTYGTGYGGWGGKRAKQSVTFTCDVDHEHYFWTDNKYWTKNGTTSADSAAGLQQFDVVQQGKLGDSYYCVIESGKGVYTGSPQKLYCGKADSGSIETTWINNRYYTSPNYWQAGTFRHTAAIKVNLDGVTMGVAWLKRSSANLESRGITPLFNDLQYNFADMTYDGASLYYYVGTENENSLIYYWDSYYIRWLMADNPGIYDYSDLSNITPGEENGSSVGTKNVGTVAINDGLYSAADKGYVAAGYGSVYYPYREHQKYYQIESKAITPKENVTESNTVDAQQKLVPGNTITFTVTIDPEDFDLTSDQAAASVLTKNSSVAIKSESGETAVSSEITTDNASVTRTSQKSDYTLTTLYTFNDNDVAHVHSYDYVITRADCIAALKRANADESTKAENGYNNAEKYQLDLTPSATMNYEAKLKTNGGYLTTTASNTTELTKVTATIDKEHYVHYKTSYANDPYNGDTSKYPEEIKNVSDVNKEDGGKNNQTPYWQGEVIEFAGYSVGQIVEDKELKGYWVFSGWKNDAGEYITGNLTMGDSDITVTGEWTFVSHEVHYVMDSWTYDGTYHTASASYVGTATSHVDSAPSSYTYYVKTSAATSTDGWELLGTEHPVNAGEYKVVAEWDYIITNESKIEQNKNKNDAAAIDETNGEDGDVNGEGEGSLDGGTEETPVERPANEDTITVTTEFAIHQVEVSITSQSASKLYDGYPLTATELVWDGTWIEAEQDLITAVATGSQTLPNSKSDEATCENTIVLLPALEEETTQALDVARAKAYTTSQRLSAAAQADGEEEAAPSESDVAFQKLLANYHITLNHGELTVQHRTGSDRFELELVGNSPTDLTYNGREQTVEGFTVNGFSSDYDVDGNQTGQFSLGVHEEVTTWVGASSKTAVVRAGAAEKSDDASGDNGDASGDASDDEVVWTLAGVTATGGGTNVLTTAGATYPVTVTAGDVRVYDEQGNDVTSEFTWTTQDGSFEIAPIELTLQSASASRAYDTTTLTAKSYTITQGAFVRGEGFIENRIEWTASQRRVGETVNEFSIANAWNGNTIETNYHVTLEFGTLEVLDSVDVSERMDISVSAKSQQVEEKPGQTQALDGFVSEQDGYVTYTVVSGEGESVLYLEGLSAHGEGVTPGKYSVAVSGLENVRIYDQLGDDKYDVTGCFNVTAYDGYLTIRAEGSNAVEFSNRSELTGKTYDGKSVVPVAEGLQEGTTVLYTTNEAVATAAAALPGMTDEYGKLLAGNTANGTEQAALDAGWSRAASEIVDAGTYKVWALGFKDGMFTQVEEVSCVISQRKVTLASESATKAYDGVALTAATMPRPTATSLGWVAADLAKLVITATGSQKAPGESVNTISIAAAGTFESDAAAEAAKQEVLKNYVLAEEPGTLTVTSLTGDARIELGVVGSTGTSLTYNGEEQEVTGFTINGTASTQGENGTVSTVLLVTNSDGEEVGSWTVTGVSASGTGKNVLVAPAADSEDAGEAEDAASDLTYPVTVAVSSDFKVLDEDGVDVTAQFSVTTAPGSFAIAKRPVTITSKSYTKTYDLISLTYPYYKVTAGSFATGEELNEAGIEWTGIITSPGSVANTFNLDNAWTDITLASNYAVSVVTGTLTVNHITNAADKLQVSVKSKSAKERLSTETGSYTITGFEGEITVGTRTYIPVKVSRNGFTATLYVTNLKASVTGSSVGTYANTITGTPLVYDSTDANTRVSVTSSVNVEQIVGKLKLYGPDEDILVWTNENDVTTTDAATGEVTTVPGIDGTYYDGDAKTPAIESRFYKQDAQGQELTTVYYTQDAEAAKKAETDLSDLTALVNAEKNSEAGAAAADDASGTTSAWSTDVPTFTNAGSHTFYAVGVRDYADDADADADEPSILADASSDTSNRVNGGKRYTQVEEFTLRIKQRPVTLTTEDVVKTYDGTAAEVKLEVSEATYEGDGSASTSNNTGFVKGDKEKLTITVATQEGGYILPGTYEPTITVTETTAEGEEGIATQDTGDTMGDTTSVLSNYQVITSAGKVIIETRVGEERYKLTEYVPEHAYEYTGSTIKIGALSILDKDGTSSPLYVAQTNEVTYVTITAENNVQYKVGVAANQYLYSRTAVGTYECPLTKFYGYIYQLNEDGTTELATTDLQANFDITLEPGTGTIYQTGGNEITSTGDWLANNDTTATGYAAAAEAYSKLNAWSTWTYTGSSATQIPAITASKGVTSTYYALDATPEGEEVLDEQGNVTTEATHTWYTWAQLKDLLVQPGEYTLSFKATSASYLPCYAYNTVTVKILERTLDTSEENLKVYDPTTGEYVFEWDEDGNLLDATDTVVANRDGEPVGGDTIEGLPVGPAVIMPASVTYTGESQQVKPVVVDDQGRLLVEGIDYTLEYAGDTTNVGSVTVTVASLPSGGYNFSFTVGYEIVASGNGALKANDAYTYIYQGSGFEEPAIVANYGDSGVVYSFNGVEYDAWSDVAEALVNVGEYRLAIKTSGENYVAREGAVVIEVLPLDMSATPQKGVESVELDDKDLEANSLYVEAAEFAYTGEAQAPEVLIVDKHGNQLLQGRDYTLSVTAVTGRSARAARTVDAAVDAGSYALEVSYRGNYTGTSYVAFDIAKVAGNGMSVDASALDGATEGALVAPAVDTVMEGSGLWYSVDGGAWLPWDQAAQLLSAGTHTLAVKATHTNYVDVVSDTFTVTIAARPASDAGSSDGAVAGGAAGSTGSTGTGTGTGASTGSSTGGSSSAGRNTAASGSTTGSNAAAATAGSEAATSEAVTVENTASGSASSSSSSASSTAQAAEAAVTHATHMYLTVTIVTGMLLTAAYSLTIIKQRSNEAKRLQARAM